MSTGKLTEAERRSLADITMGFGYQQRVVAAVEAILAEREASLRAQIAADIEAAKSDAHDQGADDYDQSVIDEYASLVLARIARGGDGA